MMIKLDGETTQYFTYLPSGFFGFPTPCGKALISNKAKATNTVRYVFKYIFVDLQMIGKMY